MIKRPQWKRSPVSLGSLAFYPVAISDKASWIIHLVSKFDQKPGQKELNAAVTSSLTL